MKQLSADQCNSINAAWFKKKDMCYYHAEKKKHVAKFDYFICHVWPCGYVGQMYVLKKVEWWRVLNVMKVPQLKYLLHTFMPTVCSCALCCVFCAWYLWFGLLFFNVVIHWYNLMCLQVIFLMTVCLLEIVDGQRLAEGRKELLTTTLMAQKEQRRSPWAALYGKVQVWATTFKATVLYQNKIVGFKDYSRYC